MLYFWICMFLLNVYNFWCAIQYLRKPRIRVELSTLDAKIYQWPDGRQIIGFNVQPRFGISRFYDLAFAFIAATSPILAFGNIYFIWQLTL